MIDSSSRHRRFSVKKNSESFPSDAFVRNSRVVNLLENVLKSAVVFLQNRVLCAEVEGLLLGQCDLETAIGEADDRLDTKEASVDQFVSLSAV